jgi:aminopeptidase YwaD
LKIKYDCRELIVSSLLYESKWVILQTKNQKRLLFTILYHFMNKFSGFIGLALSISTFAAHAQEKAKQPIPTSKKQAPAIAAQLPRTEKEWLQAQIDSLTQPGMYGRGYVNGGLDSAAKYIIRQFSKMKLKPAGAEGYSQGFAFPVNTFPGKVELSLNDERLRPGVDFLVDASSASFSGDGLKVEKINLGKIRNEAEWKETVARFDAQHAYYFENGTAFCKMLQIRKDQLAAMLPKGCFIIPEEKKLAWSVSRDTMAATVFYVKETAFPKHIKTLGATVNSVYNPHSDNENIIGEISGTVKDSYIVITAHYDNLGMMGDSTVFAGGSDNASGVAMMLSLANYFSTHPQRYSILFIAFAGEQASLMGSEYFVWHPLVPLKNIKFLANIDIMGDATDGLSVVNASIFPTQFALLQKINQEYSYLPKIFAKDPAANSDQYHFTTSGVPSFFIYSVGGQGFCHDVYDTGDVVTLENVSNVAKLMIDFVKQL